MHGSITGLSEDLSGKRGQADSKPAMQNSAGAVHLSSAFLTCGTSSLRRQIPLVEVLEDLGDAVAQDLIGIARLWHLLHLNRLLPVSLER